MRNFKNNFTYFITYFKGRCFTIILLLVYKKLRSQKIDACAIPAQKVDTDRPLNKHHAHVLQYPPTQCILRPKNPFQNLLLFHMVLAT